MKYILSLLFLSIFLFGCANEEQKIEVSPAPPISPEPQIGDYGGTTPQSVPTPQPPPPSQPNPQPRPSPVPQPNPTSPPPVAPPTTQPIAPPPAPFGQLQLTSNAFNDGDKIPQKYTCDGQDINPQLSINRVPNNALSLAIIMDDPDADYPDTPDRAWVHWVVWNIPADTKEIAEGQGENIGVQGTNSGEVGYSGPCPPAKHTYRFFLYALDTTLSLQGGATREQLKSAMVGHIIAQTELDGVYSPGG